MSIMFNEISINEEMLPKYTCFKLQELAAHKYNRTLEYRRDLVKRQITLGKNNMNTLHLDNSSPSIDFCKKTLFADTIYRNKFKRKRYTLQRYRRSSYKVVMYRQKLHHFCNRSSPDDGPNLSWKYLGYN